MDSTRTRLAVWSIRTTMIVSVWTPAWPRGPSVPTTSTLSGRPPSTGARTPAPTCTRDTWSARCATHAAEPATTSRANSGTTTRP